MADVREGLIGHWPFNGDCRDHSGNEGHGQNHGVSFTPDGAAFDGKASQIEIRPSIRPGPGDFSISLHAHTDERLDDVLGDLLSQYDPATRTGFNFNIQNFAGVDRGHDRIFQ